VKDTFGELYHKSGAGQGYDGLNQLLAFARGQLSASVAGGPLDTITSPSHTQSWLDANGNPTLDALGNWTGVTTDGVTQTRTANQQNEITSISGQTTPGYDGDGNTTKDQAGDTLVYDAWNELVQVKNGNNTVLAAYGYDALGRRITETRGASTTDLYYSKDWQVLEERNASNQPTARNVWSPGYVDALVLRDRDADGITFNGLEERLYVLQDANYNVTAVAVTFGSRVVERYVYDPYGQVTVLAPDWSVRGTSSYAWAYLFQGGRFEVTTGLYQSTPTCTGPRATRRPGATHQTSSSFVAPVRISAR